MIGIARKSCILNCKRICTTFSYTIKSLSSSCAFTDQYQWFNVSIWLRELNRRFITGGARYFGVL